MSEGKKKQIRNSTAEFLTFTAQSGEQSIESRYEDGTVWLSQKLMATLFDVDVRTINEHLGNIYAQEELTPAATIRKFRIVQTEGTREVARQVDFYNLDAIISVGYRVNSIRATQFRQWATRVLRDFTIRGYVLDRKRMENGTFLDEDYFERLLEEIREIRLSERRFYQKITDVYTTAVDYNPQAPTTRACFAKVQNKLHFAIHGHTAAELIIERADSQRPHMGELLTFKNGYNADKEQYGLGVKFINVLDIIQNDFISHGRIIRSVKIPDKDFEKNEVKYGALFFQRSSETREEVGQTNVYLDRNRSATFGGFVIRGRPLKDFDPVFFNSLLKTSNARKDIGKKVELVDVFIRGIAA